MDELKNLEQEIMSCNACKRLREVTPIPYPHVMYCKPEDVRLMIIGRNPGIEHDYTDITEEEFKKIYHERWWDCKIRKYVRKRLGDDFVHNHVLFTNVIKCSSPNNDTVRMPEKHRCYPYLQRQIDLIQPKVIITMSSDARDMLQQDVQNHHYKDIPVFHMYHPSYFRYTSDKNKSTKQDRLLEEISKKLP